MMEGVLKTALQLVGFNTQAQKKENSRLLREIKETSGWIRTLEQSFELQSDPDLIEACIYEINANKARYRHLLKQAKREGISCTAEPEYRLRRSVG